MSGNEFVQLQYLTKKTPHDFIARGVTQNSFAISAVKRLGRDIQVDGSLQYERWKAPIYRTGQQNDATVTVQLTWFPNLRQTRDTIVRLAAK
jgi:hypothetical protein